MAHVSPTVAAPDAQSALGNPLADWPNSDLLLEEAHRSFVTRRHPAFSPIFDWPELRARFSQFDVEAIRAQKLSHRWGLCAVAAGVISLVVAAITPVAALLVDPQSTTQLEAWLGGLAAVFAVGSIVIAYHHILRGRKKAEWLQRRFWCERLRQLHFQLIINHLPEVLAAAQGPDGLGRWQSLRSLALAQFEHHYIRGHVEAAHALERDEAEAHPWLDAAWGKQGAIPDSSPQLSELLRLLGEQRFGIQLRYVALKLKPGWHSPETRTEWTRILSDFLTGLLLVATAVVGVGSVAVLRFGSAKSFPVAMTCVAALISIGIVTIRTLKEGLLFGADAERYRWYEAVITWARDRFAAGSVETKIRMLRELEYRSYQELRRFYMAAKQARFVM